MKKFLLCKIGFVIAALALSLAPAQSEPNLTLQPIMSGLNSPVFLTAVSGDARLFIVQQNGLISILEDGQSRDVLDIRNKVTFGNEAGLLGMALHPQFITNGRGYFSYTDVNMVSTIAEYRFDAATGVFLPASERVIYLLAQPARNHNGGMIAFGPDGLLYAGFGDGGGAFDIFGHGQNFDTALGTIIRIEISDNPQQPFDIPNDNPNTAGAAPEAWVFGLRNPWRFSFDNDLLYITDVGQRRQEEISVIDINSGGANLGWPLAEGSHCFNDCENISLTWPVETYPTSQGCAITGGYVYRGNAMPDLTGHYFYGDFCSGEVFSFLFTNGIVSERRSWRDQLGTIDALSSFGLDGFGEIYVLSLTGSISKLVPAP